MTMPEDLLLQAAGAVGTLLFGLLILLVGFVVANYVTSTVASSPLLEGRVSAIVAAGTKAVLYFAVTVIALETMGINVAILYTLAQTVGFALALAFAIAVGVAVGLGSKEYVAESIDDWSSRSSRVETGAEATADDD